MSHHWGTSASRCCRRGRQRAKRREVGWCSGLVPMGEREAWGRSVVQRVKEGEGRHTRWVWGGGGVLGEWEVRLGLSVNYI